MAACRCVASRLTLRTSDKAIHSQQMPKWWEQLVFTCSRLLFHFFCLLLHRPPFPKNLCQVPGGRARGAKFDWGQPGQRTSHSTRVGRGERNTEFVLEIDMLALPLTATNSRVNAFANLCTFWSPLALPPSKHRQCFAFGDARCAHTRDQRNDRSV